MTRKSKREIERAVDGLDGDGVSEEDLVVAYRTTDGWVDSDGAPLEEDAVVVIGFGGVTIPRSEAEAIGCEIIREADVAVDEPHVVVPYDYDGATPGGGAK